MSAGMTPVPAAAARRPNGVAWQGDERPVWNRRHPIEQLAQVASIAKGRVPMSRPPLPPFIIAVRFAYEWRDDSGNWFRNYGNENWEFAEDGLMRRRIASINDVPIRESERKYHWPLGRRPDDHPSLSDLGL